MSVGYKNKQATTTGNLYLWENWYEGSGHCQKKKKNTSSAFSGYVCFFCNASYMYMYLHTSISKERNLLMKYLHITSMISCISYENLL